MGCCVKKPHYTLHGEADPIFRKDCKICWASEKKENDSLLVRHSMTEKRYRFWTLLHRILLYFPILKKD